MKLRHYQREAIACVLDEFERHSSTLLVCPTGGGKTVMFAALISQMKDRGRAMVIAHRDELISQAYEKIVAATGIVSDIEKADQWADQRSMFSGKSPCIISSVQTQCSGRNGEGRMTRFDPNEFGLLVIDEAHHAVGGTYRRVIEHYGKNPNLKILGVTATPNRHDEEALGQVFGSCAYEYYIADAIRDGWLVPIQQQAIFIESLDLSGCRTTAGDLNGADLAKQLEYEKTLLAMADATFRECAKRKSLVFAASVAQAKRFCEILNRHEAGCAQFVHGGTPQMERRKMLAEYHAGIFRYLVNCAVATEGFDVPSIEVVVMGRPTKSTPAYTQMLGRGTRPLPGTVDGIDDYEPQAQLALNGDPNEQAAIRRKRIEDSAKPFMEVIDFVGNSGRHRLVSACDVLGGKYSDEVIARAAKMAERDGLPKNVADRLAAAQAMLEREREEAARRAKLVGKASYSKKNVNPFDVLGITPPHEPGWNKGRPPSDKMIAFLDKAGIPIAGLTFSQAGQLIGEIKRRWDSKLVSFKQAKVLERAGFSGAMKQSLAKPILDALFANNFKWPEGRPRPQQDGSAADVSYHAAAMAQAESQPINDDPGLGTWEPY